MAGQNPNMDQFEAYFQRADVDRDGKISGSEANFLLSSNLPRQILAQIWTYADQNRLGFLGRQEFYNALKLVTVAQSKQELTPELVKAALYGPASSKIPPPQINLGLLGPQENAKANPSPAQSAAASSPSQGIGASSKQALLTQPNQVTRPPRPLALSSGFQSQPTNATQGMPGTSLISASLSPNSVNSLGGSADGSQAGISSLASNRGSILSETHGNFGQIASSLTQLKVPEITGPLQSASTKPNDSGSLGAHVGKDDPQPLSSTGNGFPSNSVFGDVFSAASSQPQQNSTGPTYPTGNISVSTTDNLVLPRDQPTAKPSGVSQPPTSQAQQFQSAGKANQHVSAQKPPMFPVTAGKSQSPWPRMTHSDIQKYSKVFVQVDTDRDGKISGEQARNLFLSWRLPREVLKQVWDLSDEDNDSMLSLREFCVALYLMERYREGHSLPTVLPHSFILDETLFPGPGQHIAAHGIPSWRPIPGFQQPQLTKNPKGIPFAGVGRPPRPVPVPQPGEPIQQNAKVPELEKHLLDQLSAEEQDALNKKFEDAKDAEKKVAELEKDILEAKQKSQFYHAKMQELVLYKSRCDNRLNEISEKVVGDKREAEFLAKKYEEKYKQAGDVASKLTMEEATFRDIQEKKMELYRAIVKLDQENANGIQDRANQVQSDLEELVKTLNERCKNYGLRAKPTSILELPFGWQPGIEGTAADWDEDWDKFEDEGFTYVKELTIEVQNVIAPPKPKIAFREKVTLFDGKSPSKTDGKSELPSSEERETADDRQDTNNSERTARTPPDSPAGSNAVASPSKEFRDFRINKDFNLNGSPHAFETQSEYGGDSLFSGDKRFDEPSWGTFDSHYDADGAWDSISVTSKEAGSLFGPDEWGLNPIKTGSRGTDASLLKQGPFFDSVPSTPSNTVFPSQGSFFDSVPSTPSSTSFQKQGPFFDSVPSTPLNNLSSPHSDNLFARNSSQYAFANSVPSTPMYNFSSSPKKFSEGFEEQPSFDSFSRFDSFNMNDSGPFSSRESFTRFDSTRSTRDYTDFDQGYSAQPDTLTRFDSFRSTADSDYNFGLFPPRPSMTRFDSMSSSTMDTDHGHGVPSFDEAADPFGSSEPFRSSSHESQTTRRDSDSWKAF